MGVWDEGQACRVVIGLRASAPVEASVDAAATLAAVFQTELIGVFAKEEGIVDFAGLPFAQAVSFGAGQIRQLSRDVMVQALARSEMACRRAVSVRAERARVKWSFTLESGDVQGSLETILASGDILVLSGEGQGLGARGLLEAIRAAPHGARGVVVAAREAWRGVDAGERLSGRSRKPVQAPVIVIARDGPEADEACRLAARISAFTGEPMALLAIAASDQEAARIVERGRNAAGDRATPSVYRFQPGHAQWIAATLSALGPSFVVADLQGEPFDDDRSALCLLRAARAPVVLLR